ncbi:pyranose dehydrogenase [Cyathus striatus]|nr:pyranose dehydrogenase [Cyathus striatus]
MYSGGTAGSVIANHLTENMKFRVLILEGGPSNEGVLDIDVPGLHANLHRSPFDWNYTTVPQSGLNGQSLEYARGHVLGALVSINWMFYTRGSSDDYDRWATATGDEGWSWNHILPYILRNENFTSPADRHSTVGQFDWAFHNFTGTNYVSLPGFPRPLDDAYIQTSKDLKEEFPYDLDMNDGTPFGLGWLQSTIGNGTRSSAATSYLGPHYICRPNLDVVLRTYVSCKEYRLTILIHSLGANRTPYTLRAQKEVILSLGAIGTPHILLNLGIGDEEELQKVGVQPVLHLPSVGKNVSDHLYKRLNWTVDMAVAPEYTTAGFNQWLDNRTGPFANGVVNHVVWNKVADTSSIFNTIPDPAPGPHTPHFEFVLFGYPFTSLTGELALTLLLGVSTPMSRGSISLKSNDPFDAPLIDPAYLTADIDILIMKEAVRSAKRFFAGQAWKDTIIAPNGAFANATDDETLEHFIRSTSVSAGLHAVGTASMSPKGARYGVVDPDLLVKGTEGLRIVDASIMPIVPSGHTQAPTYAIAERAADLIKQAW